MDPGDREGETGAAGAGLGLVLGGLASFASSGHLGRVGKS